MVSITFRRDKLEKCQPVADLQSCTRRFDKFHAQTSNFDCWHCSFPWFIFNHCFQCCCRPQHQNSRALRGEKFHGAQKLGAESWKDDMRRTLSGVNVDLCLYFNGSSNFPSLQGTHLRTDVESLKLPLGKNYCLGSSAAAYQAWKSEPLGHRWRQIGASNSHERRLLRRSRSNWACCRFIVHLRFSIVYLHCILNLGFLCQRRTKVRTKSLILSLDESSPIIETNLPVDNRSARTRRTSICARTYGRCAIWRHPFSTRTKSSPNRV